MKTHGRQALLFCCFSDLTTKDVVDCYKQGPTDQYESVGIQFLSLENVVELIVVIQSTVNSRIDLPRRWFLRQELCIPF